MGLFSSDTDDEIDALVEEMHDDSKQARIFVKAVDENGLYLPDFLDGDETLYQITMGSDFLENGQECVESDESGFLGISSSKSNYIVITDKRILVVLDNDNKPPDKTISLEEITDVWSNDDSGAPVLGIDAEGTTYEFTAGKKVDCIPECADYISKIASPIETDQATGNTDTPAVDEELQELVEHADGETVTYEGLAKSQVFSALDQGEQPHHLLEGNALLIEGGDKIEKKGGVGGSVITVVTDQRMLCNIADGGIVNIPYDSITSIEYGLPPENEWEVHIPRLAEFSGQTEKLIIHTQGRVYYIDLSKRMGILPDSLVEQDQEKHAQLVNNVINFIRNKREEIKNQFTQSESKSVENDPLDQIERLKELNEDGVITDEEFQEKKEDLLDQI